MYFCLECGKRFEKSEDVAKHSLACWREHNPNHQSVSAPRGNDIETKEVDEGVLNFFSSLRNNVNATN